VDVTVDDLADIIVEFLQSKTGADARDVLLRHPELLAPEADDLFDQLINAAAYTRDTRAIEALAVIYRIVADGRRDGLDAATMRLLDYDNPELRADVDEPGPVEGVRKRTPRRLAHSSRRRSSRAHRGLRGHLSPRSHRRGPLGLGLRAKAVQLPEAEHFPARHRG
jgi:hypothetical protein